MSQFTHKYEDFAAMGKIFILVGGQLEKKRKGKRRKRKRKGGGKEKEKKREEKRKGSS